MELIEESQLLSKSQTQSSLEKDENICEKFSLIPHSDESNDTISKVTVVNGKLDDDISITSEVFYDCNSDSIFDEPKICHCKSYKIDTETIECHCDLNYNKYNNKTSNIKSNFKHLYPNVVVNTSNELSDIDSDEEDFRLRLHHKNDSGQGSSVETSSLKSNTAHDFYQVEMNNEVDALIQGKEINQMNSNCPILQDIDLSTEDKLPIYRTSSVLNRNSPDSQKKIVESNFTDIPLNTPSPAKPMNTFVPRLNSIEAIDGPHILQTFKPPIITDNQPKTRLLKGPTQKSWKIFGKIAVPVTKENSPKTSPKSHHKNKKETVGSSTTALILENRPSHLPPKLLKEELRHRGQYEEMIAAAKKKEVKDLENEKKKLKERRKLEDQLSNTVKVWKEEVIPNWKTCMSTKKVQELWWNGIPSSVRGVVWKLAIGNDLHMSKELFLIFQANAQERMKTQKPNEPAISALHNSESSLVVSKENSMGLISLDVSRTFPALCIFQKGGPYHEPLKSLLAAYTCHRPDVGYVQGMSFLAAMLLLNMDLTDAFICFANLLNRSCQMAFFMVDQPMMDAYFRSFDVLLEEQLPRLHFHFKQESLSHDIYLIDWIFTLFSKSLPLDTACRVWDLFCRDGEEFLFRTALGILLMHQDALVEMEFFRLAQYLTKLPNTITADDLFQYIEKINFSKQKFQQTLTQLKLMARSNPLRT